MSATNRKKRSVCVVTVGRSDYGIFRPVLRKILTEKTLRLRLIAAGDHLSSRGGMTVREIERDGFEIGDRVPMTPRSDTAEGVASAMGRGLSGFAAAYSRKPPDILLVLGDRFETHSAVAAAAPFGIPVAHIHGGEITEGAIDNQFRHSISKMSHLHFVSTKECARRLIRMGEEPWRVIVAGAPGLDNLRALKPLSAGEFFATLRMPANEPFLLATYHPATLEWRHTDKHAGEMLAALDRIGLPALFTSPNADMGSGVVVDAICRYVSSHAGCRFEKNLGSQLYFRAMRLAAAMVGNSSSGIIEAASFRLPVVNVGDRQKGRLRPGNVLDARCERGDIEKCVRRAISPEFRRSIRRLENPYGDGHAAERIVKVLKSVPLDRRLIQKRFFERD